MTISRKLNALLVLTLLVVNATVGIYLVRRRTTDVRRLAKPGKLAGALWDRLPTRSLIPPSWRYGRTHS